MAGFAAPASMSETLQGTVALRRFFAKPLKIFTDLIATCPDKQAPGTCQRAG
jgi:hypothetical protein